MVAYYNEFNKRKASWLREIIKERLVAPGDVDDRSIKEVTADDLRGYTQCHFFAGIGGWSLALRLAGWSDDRPVWTGSCPCQPYSDQGKRNAQADSRHLWPEWYRLIRESTPPELFGEQVDDAIAFGWLDQVALEMESISYAFASAVLPAASAKSPHLRERVWFYSRHPSSNRAPEKQEQESRPATGLSGICDESNWWERTGYKLPFPLLADGIPPNLRRLLREGFGDAIVPQIAAEFINGTQ
jgi:DNA (cytosine-5)-methyltransferase 1